VSDVAPPFVGFIELSQMPETTRDEMLGKMLSGEHPAYVYSSEADGRLDPARIMPAEFFKAWRRAQQEAGCDDCLDASGWPLKKMGPFQIRVPDRDIRRDRQRLVRRTIGVPHWIYLLKADMAPRKGKGGRKPVMDQNAVATEVERLMGYHGEFRADDPEWNAEARLKEAIRGKFGEAADSTIESYIKAPLANWRLSKRPSPKA
jgi:hypothetical protein